MTQVNSYWPLHFKSRAKGLLLIAVTLSQVQWVISIEGKGSKGTSIETDVRSQERYSQEPWLHKIRSAELDDVFMVHALHGQPDAPFVYVLNPYLQQSVAYLDIVASVTPALLHNCKQVILRPNFMKKFQVTVTQPVSVINIPFQVLQMPFMIHVSLHCFGTLSESDEEAAGSTVFSTHRTIAVDVSTQRLALPVTGGMEQAQQIVKDNCTSLHHCLDMAVGIHSLFRFYDSWWVATVRGALVNDGVQISNEATLSVAQQSTNSFLIYRPPPVGLGNRFLQLAQAMRFCLATRRVCLIDWNEPIPLQPKMEELLEFSHKGRESSNQTVHLASIRHLVTPQALVQVLESVGCTMDDAIDIEAWYWSRGGDSYPLADSDQEWQYGNCTGGRVLVTSKPTEIIDRSIQDDLMATSAGPLLHLSPELGKTFGSLLRWEMSMGKDSKRHAHLILNQRNRERDRPWIGVHVRTGSIKGDFELSMNANHQLLTRIVSATIDAALAATGEHLQSGFREHASAEGGLNSGKGRVTVLVVADSDMARSEIVQRLSQTDFVDVIQPPPLGESNFNSGISHHSPSSILAFRDWMLLTLCDEMVISASTTFSLTAAMFANIEPRTVCAYKSVKGSSCFCFGKCEADALYFPRKA